MTLTTAAALAVPRSTTKQRSHIDLWHSGNTEAACALLDMPNGYPHFVVHCLGLDGYPTSTAWYLDLTLKTYGRKESVDAHCSGTSAWLKDSSAIAGVTGVTGTATTKEARSKGRSRESNFNSNKLGGGGQRPSTADER